MTLSRDEIERVALLARLELSEEMIETLTDQLGDVLAYIEKLSELDTSGVVPMSHPGALHNVFREDTPAASLETQDALRNAPERADGFFRVPRVIE